MKMYVQTVLRFARLLTKAFFRDRTALFFTFVFPLIFLFVFGSLNRSDNGVSFDIALINESQSQFATEFVRQTRESDLVEVKEVSSLENAKERMSRSEIDTILQLPANFGELNERRQPTGQALVYVDPGSAQTGQTFASILEGVLGEINHQITGEKPLFSVEQQSTDTRGLSSFDYIFSGLLGFSLLTLGFFGPTNSLPSLKKEGVLRRLRSTPIRTSQFILASALNYLIVGLIAVGLMYVIGVMMFDFKMQGDYFSFAALIALGTILMFGFGMAIGGWAKNESQAAPLANLTAFPMMFLSGTFFPRFLMPDWLQGVSSFLPLTPLVDGIRYIIVEGKTLLDIGPQLGLIGLWTVAIYIIAFRVFRWE
jgi:ABC-2 type transport system permease protein